MPADLHQIPQDFHKAVEQGQLPADHIGPMLDKHVSTQLLEEVQAGRLERHQAMPAFDRIRASQKPQQQALEEAAYRRNLFIHAPETFLGAGAFTALSSVPGKAISHLTKSPMSWRQAVGVGLGPAGMPLTSLFETALLGTAPLSDPLYQRGERGYLGSLSEAAKARMSEFERAGKMTRERYGLAGAPIQVLQNTFNPLMGTAFTGKELYKSLSGPTAAELSTQAEQDLAKYLGD